MNIHDMTMNDIDYKFNSNLPY